MSRIDNASHTLYRAFSLISGILGRQKVSSSFSHHFLRFPFTRPNVKFIYEPDHFLYEQGQVQGVPLVQECQTTNQYVFSSPASELKVITTRLVCS